MTGISIGFAIAVPSALGWAVLDALRKQVGAQVSATAAVAALSLFQLPFLVPLLVVDVGADAGVWSTLLRGVPELAPGYWLPFAGCVVLNVFANWLFLRAVQVSPLGLTIPYLSFTPVFTALGALVFLGETPTGRGWAGIVIVTLGAFLLHPGTSESPASAIRALRDERGSAYMLLVALIWSVTPLLDKVAVQHSGVVAHAGLLAAAIFVVFWAGRAVVDRDATAMLREFRAAPTLLVATGAICLAAMVSQLWAYGYLPVAYVETIKRGVGVVAATLAGWAVFAEGNLARRLVAALVMALGVALILL